MTLKPLSGGKTQGQSTFTNGTKALQKNSVRRFRNISLNNQEQTDQTSATRHYEEWCFCFNQFVGVLWILQCGLCGGTNKILQTSIGQHSTVQLDSRTVGLRACSGLGGGGWAVDGGRWPSCPKKKNSARMIGINTISKCQIKIPRI